MAHCRRAPGGKWPMGSRWCSSRTRTWRAMLQSRLLVKAPLSCAECSSPTLCALTPPCSTIWISFCPEAQSQHWWGDLGRGSPPLRLCSPGSMSHSRVPFTSTAGLCQSFHGESGQRPSPWSVRSLCSFPAPLPTTSGTLSTARPAWQRSRLPRRLPMHMNSSRSCLRATTRLWATGECCCQEGSGSGWPWHAHCSRTRPSSSWMRPPAPWTA
mmetsp:Transcript_18398/g.51567  ORF Transcript_18398/g.51567 Transcript_18398/m.51567 type:complete len:213 (+) Transcript_18398:1291-1929(+)